jgi:hypothetical protein
VVRCHHEIADGYRRVSSKHGAGDQKDRGAHLQLEVSSLRRQREAGAHLLHSRGHPDPDGLELRDGAPGPWFPTRILDEVFVHEAVRQVRGRELHWSFIDMEAEVARKDFRALGKAKSGSDFR